MNENEKRICSKCKNIYEGTPENIITHCPQCQCELEPYTHIALSEKIKQRFQHFSPETKKYIKISLIAIAAILILVIGIIIGRSNAGASMVSIDKYQEMEKSRDKYINSESKLKEEYDAYKTKMQPYEAQQEADEKAAKEAEEKAKKEAEENAKQQAGENAKAGTLGLTTSDFRDKFNKNCSAINSTISINNPSYEDTETAYIQTTSNSISFNIVKKNNYIQSLAINYTISSNTDSDFDTFSDVMLASAYTVDSSVDTQGFAKFLADLLHSGEHVEKTYNGLKYRVDSDTDYITLSIRK